MFVTTRNIDRVMANRRELVHPRRLEVSGSRFPWEKFIFGFSISGAVVSLNAGEVHIGSKSVYDVSATNRTLTADHQYLWIEFLLGASTSPAWAQPSTQRPKSDASTYRQWFYRFRFIEGVGSLESIGHIGNIELPGSYA